jgi:oligopeptide transport system substrate-binding protein
LYNFREQFKKNSKGADTFMKKLVSILLLAAMTVSMLTGCGGGAEKSTENKKIVKLAKDVELASMDQCIVTDGLSFEIIAATIEGLYSVDKDGNLIPAIAKDHEVSDDGLTYTFTLRDDVKWSNGEKVTANDFVYAWRRFLNPETASEYNFMGEISGVKNGVAVAAGELPVDELGISAPDESTVIVELERPTPYFLSLMSFPTFYPLNQAFVEEKGDTYGTEPENVLANGPYKMTEWNKGYGYLLEKNADYYDAENVNVDGLEFRVVKDNQTAALEYESNKMDVVKLNAELVNKYKDKEGYTEIEAGYLWYMAPNNKDEVFTNFNARKALQHAINKEFIVNDILSDGSMVADYIIPKGLSTGPNGKDFRVGAKTYSEYDVEKAVEYWNKAKQELGLDKVEVELLFDDSETVKKMAEFIQAELSTNLPGLEVALKAQPKKNRLDLMRDGDYDIGLTRWGPDYADPLTYLDLFTIGNINNYANHESEEYDAIVDSTSKGDLSSKPEERWNAMHDAEEILLDVNAGVTPLYQTGYAYLVDTKVTGIEPHSVGVPFIYKNVKISE